MCTNTFKRVLIKIIYLNLNSTYEGYLLRKVDKIGSAIHFEFSVNNGKLTNVSKLWGNNNDYRKYSECFLYEFKQNIQSFPRKLPTKRLPTKHMIDNILSTFQ